MEWRCAACAVHYRWQSSFAACSSSGAGDRTERAERRRGSRSGRGVALSRMTPIPALPSFCLLFQLLHLVVHSSRQLDRVQRRPHSPTAVAAPVCGQRERCRCGPDCSAISDARTTAHCNAKHCHCTPTLAALIQRVTPSASTTTAVASSQGTRPVQSAAHCAARWTHPPAREHCTPSHSSLPPCTTARRRAEARANTSCGHGDD